MKTQTLSNFFHSLSYEANYDKILNDVALICNELIGMIHAERYLSKNLWLDIVKSIHHAYQGSIKGLEVLIEKTKQSLPENIPAFLFEYETLENTCEHYYINNKDPNITIKTLAWHAKNDNKEKYDKWHINWCLEELVEDPDLNIFVIVTTMSRYFWLDFVCFGENNKIWYQFENRWIEKDYDTIKDKVKTEFIEFITKELKHESYEKFEALVEKLECDQKINAYMNLFSFPFCNQNNVMDHNLSLTGCENGVIEIENDKSLIFRQMKPEDYVSLSTGLNYDKDYSWSNPEVRVCFDWLHGVFPDVNILHKFIKFCCSGLNPSRNNKFWGNWYGKENTQKSSCLELLELTYGDYCVRTFSDFVQDGEWKLKFLKDSKKSSFAKFNTVSDFDNKNTINSHIIKMFTGDDCFEARLIGENKESFKNNSSLLIVSNDPIKSHESLENRKVDISFDINNAGYTINYNKDFAKVFLWIVCENYRYYVNEGF